jgi:hypothetical protein
MKSILLENDLLTQAFLQNCPADIFAKTQLIYRENLTSKSHWLNHHSLFYQTGQKFNLVCPQTQLSVDLKQDPKLHPGLKTSGVGTLFVSFLSGNFLGDDAYYLNLDQKKNPEVIIYEQDQEIKVLAKKIITPVKHDLFTVDRLIIPCLKAQLLIHYLTGKCEHLDQAMTKPQQIKLHTAIKNKILKEYHDI